MEERSLARREIEGKVVATVPVNPITEMISLRNLGIAELPLQKLSVAVAMLVLLGSGFILLLIVATQKIQQRIDLVKRGSGGFHANRSCTQIH